MFDAIRAAIFVAKSSKYIWRTTIGRHYVFRDAPDPLVSEWVRFGAVVRADPSIERSNIWDRLVHEAELEISLRIRRYKEELRVLRLEIETATEPNK